MPRRTGWPVRPPGCFGDLGTQRVEGAVLGYQGAIAQHPVDPQVGGPIRLLRQDGVGELVDGLEVAWVGGVDAVDELAYALFSRTIDPGMIGASCRAAKVISLTAWMISGMGFPGPFC